MTHFDACLEEMYEMIRARRSFFEIEDWIDQQQLSSELKAALWLLAFGDQPRHPNEHRGGDGRDGTRQGVSIDRALS